MNLLASAIPGLREIRAPLVAGYIWLLSAWLVVQPKTPITAHVLNGPAGLVVQLAHVVGPVATAAAVSVAAYLVGAVSVALPGALIASATWLLSPVAEPLTLGSLKLSVMPTMQAMEAGVTEPIHEESSEEQTDVAEPLDSMGLSKFEQRSLRPYRRDWLYRKRRALGFFLVRLLHPSFLFRISRFELLPNVDRLLSGDPTAAGIEFEVGRTRTPTSTKGWDQALSQLVARPAVRPPALDDTVDLLRERGSDLTRAQMLGVLARLLDLSVQIERELDLPSTLLVGDQPEVYAEADRQRAEAEFRLAVVLPLSALTVVMTVTGGWWWVFLAVAPFALLLSGEAKRHEARLFVMNSIQSGKTPSPSVRRFREFVDRTLGEGPNVLKRRGES
jgi:hypothetical protein